MNFHLEQRSDVWCVVWSEGGGVQPASLAEIALWRRVQGLKSQLCEERRKRHTWIGWPAERTEARED